LSKDPEELELEALQRQLDDAFETTRPRQGFEDELWLRMQRRRPFGERVRDLIGGFAAGFREAPLVPLGTIALLVIVVVGLGVVGPNLLNLNHNSYSTALAPQAGAGASRGDLYAPNGKVPTPALHPGFVDTATGIQAPQAAAANAAPPNVYYGPANLTWTGAFATDSVSAPVLVYTEPSASEKSTAAGSFGPQSGATVQTRGSVAQLPREPIFIVTEASAGATAGADPQQSADAFLAAHNLVPAWQYNVVVIPGAGVTRVIYQRAFAVQNGDVAYLVDWNGDRYGLEVDIVNGRRSATGPLPLGLQSVTLTLISNDDAARLALAQPPAGTSVITPTPTVKLDRAELVYALAIAGPNGFYEPAYLFTGQFTYNGQTYEKRVLVPLVAAAFRS
jgi:hypothetical protein